MGLAQAKGKDSGDLPGQRGKRPPARFGSPTRVGGRLVLLRRVTAAAILDVAHPRRTQVSQRNFGKPQHLAKNQKRASSSHPAVANVSGTKIHVGTKPQTRCFGLPLVTPPVLERYVATTSEVRPESWDPVTRPQLMLTVHRLRRLSWTFGDWQRCERESWHSREKFRRAANSAARVVKLKRFACRAPPNVYRGVG